MLLHQSSVTLKKSFANGRGGRRFSRHIKLTAMALSGQQTTGAALFSTDQTTSLGIGVGLLCMAAPRPSCYTPDRTSKSTVVNNRRRPDTDRLGLLSDRNGHWSTRSGMWKKMRPYFFVKVIGTF